MIVTYGQTFYVDTTWVDPATQQIVSGSEILGGNGNVLEYMSGIIIVSSVTVSDGGSLYVEDGGTASGTVVSSGGFLDDGGTANGTVVSNGGALDVAGGTASSTVVDSGGTLDDYYGATSDTVVSSGGTLGVYDGIASDIVVSSDGTLGVYGGIASDIVVSSGGTLKVGEYGTASDVIVNRGGSVIVSHGIVSGDIKGSGAISFRGVNKISASGTIINVREIIISSKGTLIFYENIKYYGQILDKINASIIVNDFKSLKLTGTSTFFGAINGKGTLYFDGGRDTFGNSSIITVANVFISNGAIISVDTVKSQKVSFAGNGGDLELTNVAHFKSAISGFGSGDTLDLTGFGFASGATLAFSENAARTKGKLIVTEGSQQFSVFLLGQYSQAGFHEASDGQAGTSITYTPPASLKPTLLLGAHS